MASLRDIRRRIASVKNTRQITRAMKLVAGAKLRRATDAALAAKPYQDTLARVLARVAAAAGDSVEHPLLTAPDNDTDVLVVLMTSDRGLCGGFNNQLAKRTQEEIDRLIAEGRKVRILGYGKKGIGYFTKRGYDVETVAIDIHPSTYEDLSRQLADRLVAALQADEFSRVMLAYNEYRNAMSQPPMFQQLLPMSSGAAGDDEPTGPAGEAEAMLEKLGTPMPSTEYLYEPNGQYILDRLLPMALQGRILQAFLETQAGEQAARMTAMDNATRNAGEIIDSLTLAYNRARQAAITTELTEIVSGAEAL
ncbi:MAG: ATP synthase F1 subunit gamma [Deltaproteobacteria bacterium]|nr:MAG: ATP synthase F1 subunit gamma [Deltaproteobacteria bacterium]